MAENHAEKSDVARMKQLIADLEKRVEAVEKQREQRKVWVRPPASDADASANAEAGAFAEVAANEDAGAEAVSQENGNAVKENGVGKELTLQFEVQNATTQPGQNIYATGNLKELGAFSSSGSVKLSAEAYPTWQGEATVHDYNGEPVQVKFFKMTDNDEGGIEWDSHGEYTITPSENTFKHSVSWTS